MTLLIKVTLCKKKKKNISLKIPILRHEISLDC